MGASGFGYQIARQFGLTLTETRPALVPLTFGPKDLDWMAPLAGVALPVSVGAGAARFNEAALFTHRGLSGPAILQISSYWREGAPAPHVARPAPRRTRTPDGSGRCLPPRVGARSE
jgi:predicted flavoprotein YhiN